MYVCMYVCMYVLVHERIQQISDSSEMHRIGLDWIDFDPLGCCWDTYISIYLISEQASSNAHRQRFVPFPFPRLALPGRDQFLFHIQFTSVGESPSN